MLANQFVEDIIFSSGKINDEPNVQKKRVYGLVLIVNFLVIQPSMKNMNNRKSPWN